MREFAEVDEFQTVITREGSATRSRCASSCKPDADRRALGQARGRCRPSSALAHEGLNFRIERAGGGELPRFELKAKRTRRQARRSDRGGGSMSVDLHGQRADPARGTAAGRLRGAKALCADGPAAGRRTRTSPPRWRSSTTPSTGWRSNTSTWPTSACESGCRIAVVRRRPGGPLLLDPDAQDPPRLSVTVFERNRPRTRSGSGSSSPTRR